MNDLRALPAVDQLLRMEAGLALIQKAGRWLALQALREELEACRSSHQPGTSIPSAEEILTKASKRAAGWLQSSLHGVINATGVILHTNLGRAPLSAAALAAIEETSRGYSTLEFDLTHGKRGSRSQHAEMLLTRLTGAEAALVVNNNAAAVLLCLSALARNKRVLIPRSQLVEIGGGFRIPDVLRQSGAKLIELGATNRVHLADFETELQQPTALILHAHTSNFRMIGFTSEPALAEIAALAHQHNTLLMDDLGSGALLDTARWGLAHEPTVQESLAAGADLLCFSGDKLLGGPQAGIILGRADWIEKIKKHPLARAVRADKLCLAALSATLIPYLRGEAEQEIPIWRMISASLDHLRTRAEAWQTALGIGSIRATLSTVGGGSLPEETLPGIALALNLPRPNSVLSTLRSLPVPVIARVDAEQVILDPRTVLPEQDTLLIAQLQSIHLRER